MNRTPVRRATEAFMPPILRRLAPKLGAVVDFEPEYEVVGRIRFPNGRQSLFWHNKFNLNSVISARMAQDKGYTAYFLKQSGFQVPDSLVVFGKRALRPHGMEEIRSFAARHAWNVYFKPLRGSGGDGILRSNTEAEFEATALSFFPQHTKCLVQEACSGGDYRIVVLDGKVIDAYQRLPLSLTGDGRSTVAELMVAKQAEFVKFGRDTILKLADPRLSTGLSRHGLCLESVLTCGQHLEPLDVANLSCGGTTKVVGPELHPQIAKLAIDVAACLDLRFAGVDVLLQDHTAPPKDYRILEINSAPGLDHYGGSGLEHQNRIDDLYLQVLQAVAQG